MKEENKKWKKTTEVCVGDHLITWTGSTALFRNTILYL